MKSESTYILEILTILDKAKNDDYPAKGILNKVVKHLDIVQDHEINIDIISTGVSQEEKNKYEKIEGIVDQLENEKIEITFQDIITEALKIDISEEEVKKIIAKFKQEGIIFEPRKNIYKKLIWFWWSFIVLVIIYRPSN